MSRVEDLQVYRKLCELHLAVCALTKHWPKEELFELGSQVRRASNSAPANLAEKQSDRHMRNRIEGVNRARGEVLETIHHLFVARLKGYLADEQYALFRSRYDECVRMLNGLERAFEQQLAPADRHWPAVGTAPAIEPLCSTIEPEAGQPKQSPGVPAGTLKLESEAEDPKFEK